MWLRKLRRGQETCSWTPINDTNDSYWAPAKDLDIKWGSNNRYWHWQEGTDAAELRQSWLVRINTTFDASKLPTGKYEVFFEIKLTESARGWDSPVKLRLASPRSPMKLRQLDFSRLEKNQHRDVSVGEFEVSDDNKGMLVIQLVQNDSGHMKTGLVVKGVKILPKSQTETGGGGRGVPINSNNE